MGFEFGAITNLDFGITLYCFIAVVSFVILFEYLIGIMEYFLEGSHLYSHMIQMIYKELMLMGLVTFCVIMYEAAPDGGITEAEENWISAIDFSHVYLFFVTFFFVMHAFYLMFMSVWSASRYRSMFTEKTIDLVGAVEKAKANWWDSFLFSIKELPVCNLRNRVEFSIIHSLFLKTYLIPGDFDFPYYLSGCFDRFALRTINRSMFTWVVLLVIVACNFVRIQVGWSCAVPGGEEEERRRFLQETDEPAEEGGESEHNGCKHETIYLFLACGLALIAYTIILTMVSRLYKIRLVDRIYPNHSSIDDYLVLLRNKHRQRRANDPLASMRHDAQKLKKELEVEFDEEEEGEEEDEEGIKFLAELLLSAYRWVKESYSDLVVHINVKIAQCCSSKTRADRRQNMLGIFNSPTGKRRSVSNDAQERGGNDALRRSGSFAQGHGRVTEEKRVYLPLKHRLTVSKVLPSSAQHGSALDVESAAAHESAHSSGLLDCCHPKELEEEHSCEFKSIFVGGHPLWYFRAVELQIMFTCMYMALWATNFITIVKDTNNLSAGQEGLYQFLMLIPILVAFHRIAYIAETYSLILAISELNIEVIYDVLVNSEDMERMAEELRAKISAKIRSWSGVADPTDEQERDFVHLLFMEVDQDGSGSIDKGEFRMMLRKLNLTYSDHRFNLLFRAVDSIGGDGCLEEEELVSFMFPGNGSQAGDLDAELAADAEANAAAQRFLGATGAGGTIDNSDLGSAAPFGKMNPML